MQKENDMPLFGRLFGGMQKTRSSMDSAINATLDGRELNEDVYEELEEILIMADTGTRTACMMIETLRERAKKQRIKTAGEVKMALREIVAEMLGGGNELDMITMPAVILVIGVNGVGKTTSIGKIAALYQSKGKKVLLGAADTFRAAAIDQLAVWSNRAGVDLIKHHEGADPAAVVFDTIQAGKARDVDLIICDTAGRLHNKKNLHGAKRRAAGEIVQGSGGHYRHCFDEAGRHRQGRRGGGH
jgi:fused signal recognition particle receptor